MPIEIKLLFKYQGYCYYAECFLDICVIKKLAVRPVMSKCNTLGVLIDSDVFPDVYLAAQTEIQKQFEAIAWVENQN